MTGEVGPPPAPRVPTPTDEERQYLYQLLHSAEKKEKKVAKSGILSVVPIHADRYIPRTVQLDIPKSLSKLYRPDCVNMPAEELLLLCKRTFQDLTVTDEQVS